MVLNTLQLHRTRNLDKDMDPLWRKLPICAVMKSHPKDFMVSCLPRQSTLHPRNFSVPWYMNGDDSNANFCFPHLMFLNKLCNNISPMIVWKPLHNHNLLWFHNSERYMKGIPNLHFYRRGNPRSQWLHPWFLTIACKTHRLIQKHRLFACTNSPGLTVVLYNIFN